MPQLLDKRAKGWLPLVLLLCCSTLAMAEHEFTGRRASGIYLEGREQRDDTVVLHGSYGNLDVLLTTEQAGGALSSAVTFQAQNVIASGEVIVNGQPLGRRDMCAPKPPACNPLFGKLQFDGQNFICACEDGFSGGDCSASG
ncbi:EGF-like domain-containing protein [Pseudoscourfieldia marina]